MTNLKRFLFLVWVLLLSGFGAFAQGTVSGAPDYFFDHLQIVYSINERWGPQPANNFYLEYEAGFKSGIFDYFGYINMPKTFGIGKNIEGVWEKNGAKVFTDMQGRMSINGLLGKEATDHFLREFFVSGSYVGNFGRVGQSSHSLWLGLGTTVNTYSPFKFEANFYYRRTFSNFQSGNEYTFGGYRIKLNWGYPLGSILNDKIELNYIGFGDYDFDLNKRPKDRPSDDIGSNDALNISNGIDFAHKGWHFNLMSRFWHHGGENRYNGGSFPVRTSGWGIYFVFGHSIF